MNLISKVSERIHRQIVLIKYRSKIKSFAEHNDLPRRCFGMDYLKSSLYVLIQKGAEKEQPMNVLVALAGHISNLIIYQMVVPFWIKAPENDKGYKSYRDKVEDESLNRSANWLYFDSVDEFTDYKDLINVLFHFYFPGNPQKDSQTA